MKARFVSGIKVIYSNDARDRPREAVTEINDYGDDINKGFRGLHVWLVPQWTNNPRNAAVRFELAIQDVVNPAHWNLAKGAGGDFRYLFPMYNHGQTEKITNISLVRHLNEVSEVPTHYHGMTGDINKGRGGHHLYLIWTIEAVESSPLLYVSGFSVAYGTQPSHEPEGAVTEIHGNGDSINKLFNGK
ncbi:hypothetical protein WOLCODRAFT_92728 [Wolfiporia cocos MD-104 SS10]|uniref:Uncharacterized protein n=1 Tax=Wolfiporia cocos (strain MD-104) TaxID=742152 RepID=A0A2H3ISK2_WOLCO|nr:hypothetical protein WOLCODRAFT_92728 [Wolfiporia cocos MD-104 SS10]